LLNHLTGYFTGITEGGGQESKLFMEMTKSREVHPEEHQLKLDRSL